MLINNAGIGALAPAIEADLAVVRKVHEVRHAALGLAGTGAGTCAARWPAGWRRFAAAVGRVF